MDIAADIAAVWHSSGLGKLLLLMSIPLAALVYQLWSAARCWRRCIDTLWQRRSGSGNVQKDYLPPPPHPPKPAKIQEKK